MLCKVCQTDSPNEHCSYLCKQHGACLDKLENGTEDEKELAQHAIQRHDIVQLFPDILPTLEKRHHDLEHERLALLAQEKTLKQEGNKAELKVVTKAKSEVNSKRTSYKVMTNNMRTWKNYGMFEAHSSQCMFFRRWREEFEAHRTTLDPEHEEVLHEMMQLIAPR
jgi:hypothetical protein